MNATEVLADVTITHKCGHAVTYQMPRPRPACYRTDAQIGRRQCDACKAEKKRPRAIVLDTLDGNVHVVFIQGSYDIRESLSQSGYVFSKPYNDKIKAAWSKTIPADDLKAELDWIRGNGWDA